MKGKGLSAWNGEKSLFLLDSLLLEASPGYQQPAFLVYAVTFILLSL